MVECLAVLAEAWSLDWTPLPASAEACAVLGIEFSALHAKITGTDPHSAKGVPLAEQEAAAPEAKENEGERSCSKADCRTAVQHVFHELLRALVQLASIPQASGVR